MRLLVYLSDFCIPLLLFYMISYGLLTKTDIYKEFTEGAKDGFRVTFGILPTLIGLMTGVGMLRASGFLEMLSGLLKPRISMLSLLLISARSLLSSGLVAVTQISLSSLTESSFRNLRRTSIHTSTSRTAVATSGRTGESILLSSFQNFSK